MNQCDRIRQILIENKLRQNQFARGIGITESYTSKLLHEPNIRVSLYIAALIEEKYGYNAEWVLHGTEPKYKKDSEIEQASKNNSLSEIHQEALEQLEKMNDEQVKVVLAFISFLKELKKTFGAGN